MSMFGSLMSDYKTWKNDSAERLVGMEQEGYERAVREAFVAGAAAIVGGACKVQVQEGDLDAFLDEYVKQIDAQLAELGIVIERGE